VWPLVATLGRRLQLDQIVDLEAASSKEAHHVTVSEVEIDVADRSVRPTPLETTSHPEVSECLGDPSIRIAECRSPVLRDREVETAIGEWRSLSIRVDEWESQVELLL
jgi:hypothetical protein